MKSKAAYEKLHRDNKGAIALLSTVSERMVEHNVDDQFVDSINSIIDILKSDKEALDEVYGMVKRLDLLARIAEDEYREECAANDMPDEAEYQTYEEDLPPEDQDEVCDDYPEDDEVFIDDGDYQVSYEPMDPDELPPEED